MNGMISARGGEGSKGVSVELAINQGTTFLIVNQPGDVLQGTEYGLYRRDIRYLSHYQLRFSGMELITLTARMVDHQRSVHVLTNPQFGDWAQGSFVLNRRRTVADGLREEIVINSYVDQFLNLELQLSFEADFQHIFQVRGHISEPPCSSEDMEASINQGEHADPSRLLLSCPGRHPGWLTEIRFSQPPDLDAPANRPLFRIGLPGRGSARLTLDMVLHQPNDAPHHPRPTNSESERAGRITLLHEAEASFVETAPRLETDSFPLKQAYDRAIRDLAALRIKGEHVSEHEDVVAAGIPWFMALFGRDSLITGYQMLPYIPDIARGALRALARLQGTQFDPTTQEEPGKILHEYRTDTSPGHEALIPHFPYYGTIDATPLFLMLLRETFRWTGDLALVNELWQSALKALKWMDAYGDEDHDGYIEYLRRGTQGLQNQGWKDSWDSVRFRDGRLAEGSIALCEVQGYAYAARLGMAELAEVLGEHDLAVAQRIAAESLRTRFNSDFWLPLRSTYALALDGKKQLVDSATSNPGHCLWSGIADETKAAEIAQSLLSDDMFSGWGVRSMGEGEGGYNPIGYHTGTVWPHDNALIADGLARYGHRAEANRIVEGMLASVERFELYRLPELFGGYSRSDFGFPVEYPTACSPQAWASGTIPLLLSTLLGLRADVQRKRIEIHPMLPAISDPISYLRLSGIKIGDGELDIEVQNVNGELRTSLRKVPHGFKVEGTVFHWSLFW